MPTRLRMAEISTKPFKTATPETAMKPTAAETETVVDKLADTGGGHVTRDVAFTKDGKRMLVSVGSQSNFPNNLEAKSSADITAFEKEHGLGATWGAETSRADVLSFTPEGKDRKPFATGLRNCVGLERNPSTGDIYCSVNERDALGNNLVPDYLTRVKEGGFTAGPGTTSARTKTRVQAVGSGPTSRARWLCLMF